MKTIAIVGIALIVMAARRRNSAPRERILFATTDSNGRVVAGSKRLPEANAGNSEPVPD